MTTLEKKMKALSAGKELPWDQIVSLLENYGARVEPPRGGGSHFKIIYPGHATIIVPVHKGKIKRIYASKIASLLEELN